MTQNQTEDLREKLVKTLPEFWERSRTTRLTEGIVNARTLANRMANGTGPSGAYRAGRKVIMTRDAFIDWLMARVEPAGKEG